MNSKDLIFALLDATREDPQRGVICLIGKAQMGKTHTISEYGKERGLPNVILNAQNTPEEEIAGYPLRDEKHNRVFYSDPPALTTMLETMGLDPSNPYILFLDEADKPDRAKLNILLTLLNPEERRLRHFTLNQDVLVCAAMNPPTAPLPEPFVARMLFVPYPLNEQDMLSNLPDTVKHIAVSTMSYSDVGFPSREVTKGSFFKLSRWFDFKPFWDNEDLKSVVVRGLFPEQSCARIMEMLADRPMIGDPLEWIKVARPQALLAGLIKYGDAIPNNEPEKRNTFFGTFIERAEKDKTGEIKIIYEALLQCGEAVDAVGRIEKPEDLEKANKALADKVKELSKDKAKGKKK